MELGVFDEDLGVVPHGHQPDPVSRPRVGADGVEVNCCGLGLSRRGGLSPVLLA